MPQIKCTRKVRELMVELDGALERRQDAMRRGNQPGATHQAVTEAMLDKQALDTLIIGIANRMNKASKGQ